MKIISNEDFQKAWEDPDNTNIMQSTVRGYQNIPSEELERCKMLGLWDAMKTFKPKSKFTTHLVNCVRYRCLETIRQIEQEQQTIIPEVAHSGIYVDLRYALIELEDESQTLITQRFISNMTYKEIGDFHKFSSETARRKTKKAINEICGV